MRESLRQQVLQRIERDYGLKHRPGTEYMRGGLCPSCSKKELYTNHARPWVLRCGRQAKCGREVAVKELYDDLFDDWSRRHERTPTSPNAAADAYLHYSRGFELEALRGLYTQESFHDRKINEGTATVRFPLAKGGYWERLIDRPHRFGKQKARFMPGQSYAGTWWIAPSVTELLATTRELWITEGIFDAMALMQHGLTAVSGMSSNAYPEDSLRALRDQRIGRLPTLVWAYDNDPKACDYVRRHVRRAEALGFASRAALIAQKPGTKTDWNDLHLRAAMAGSTSERRSQWDSDIAEARYLGDLLLAKTAVEKGALMHAHSQRREFHLEHRSRLYWFSFDGSKFDKLCQERAKRQDDPDEELDDAEADKIRRACSSVEEIANCYPEALYFQSHEVTDESWYFFRVSFPHDAPPVKGTFTGAQVASASEFKKRLISMAQGAVFTGTGHQLDCITRDVLYNITKVQTIDFVGYSAEHASYILGDIAVREGEVSVANAEDYFEFKQLRVKTTQKSIRLDIQRDAQRFRTDWLPWLWTCFGTHGMIALTFWFGSLFANQIRSAHKSFPFLEATGEAGAGKTTLLTFLWKLLGRSDYEGFDPAKSSKAGRARAMGQISGMPVVLLEADRSDADRTHAKAFEWDELKDYYGGGTLATRGVRNGGNDTYEPPFRGTICISQNAAVDASEAILTRIVKLHFRKPKVTTESRMAADNLNALQVEELSHFLIRAVRAEAQVLKVFSERLRAHEAQLREREELRMERVIKNHAQMLALLDALGVVLPIPDDIAAATRSALAAAAIERQSAVSADHPLVTEFWEVYEYLQSSNGGLSVVNHSRDPALIAINLNEFAAKAAQHSQQLADLKLLRSLLRDSRRHKCQDTNVAVNSAIRKGANGLGSSTVKCWIFNV
jgi:hypothetical protein